MKAILHLRRRVDFSDGSFAEMVIWSLPTSTPPSQHKYKYRLAYVANGKRIIGYDNERGKGDHRHIGKREEAYRFTSVENLIASFFADIYAARRET